MAAVLSGFLGEWGEKKKSGKKIIISSAPDCAGGYRGTDGYIFGFSSHCP